MDPVSLLQQFVSAYGPPGEEDEVRACLLDVLEAAAVAAEIDAKGNVIVRVGDGDPNVVVTAHLDEIALMVRAILPDGRLAVAPLGGIHPWKIGEGPVDVLADAEILPGVLSFGSIHTDDRTASTVQAREKALTWDMTTVFTGLSVQDLQECGVRPGTRVVVAKRSRKLTHLGSHVSGYFLDDRADLVSWLLALTLVANSGINAIFAATASEEVGGEGALWLLEWLRPSVCISLELGPNVPDAPVEISEVPTVWVKDSYSAMASTDLRLLASVGREVGMDLQYQAFSRGGSDATVAASHGVCARPITLGLPMDNSHGYEIMHRDAMDSLARLTVALLRRLDAYP